MRSQSPPRSRSPADLSHGSSQRAGSSYTSDTLAISTEVLRLNPEFQTGWGIRRTILLALTAPSPSSPSSASEEGAPASSDVAAKQALLSADLPLTIESLKRNPKNYSVWEHRKWLLETMPEADWTAEFGMVNLYLRMDARNCMPNPRQPRRMLCHPWLVYA